MVDHAPALSLHIGATLLAQLSGTMPPFDRWLANLLDMAVGTITAPANMRPSQ